MAEHVDCPVCYEEIVDHPAPPGKKATGSTKTSCGHTFHPGCMATWYVKHTNCPLCRAEATEFEKPKLPEQPNNKNITHFNAVAVVGPFITNDELAQMATEPLIPANQNFYNLNYLNNIITNYNVSNNSNQHVW